MLSEAERRSLDEIEQRLRTEEPDLARALKSWRPVKVWLFYAVMFLFGGLSVVMVTIAAFGAAVMCLGVAAGAALLYRYPVKIEELPGN